MKNFAFMTLLGLFSFIGLSPEANTQTACGDADFYEWEYTDNFYNGGAGWETYAEAASYGTQAVMDRIDVKNQSLGMSCAVTCEHNGGAGLFACAGGPAMGTSPQSWMTVYYNWNIGAYFVEIHYKGDAGLACDDCPPTQPTGPVPF